GRSGIRPEALVRLTRRARLSRLAALSRFTALSRTTALSLRARGRHVLRTVQRAVLIGVGRVEVEALDGGGLRAADLSVLIRVRFLERRQRFLRERDARETEGDHRNQAFHSNTSRMLATKCGRSLGRAGKA